MRYAIFGFVYTNKIPQALNYNLVLGWRALSRVALNVVIYYVQRFFLPKLFGLLDKDSNKLANKLLLLD